MTSGNFRIATIARVLVTMGLLTLFLLILLRTNLVTTAIILFIAICISVYELIRYVESGNRNFSDFLLSIRGGDFTKHNTTDKRGKSFEELKDAFNTILEEFQAARIAREEQYTFLQSVMGHLSTAIICFDKTGKIKLINDAAYKLLNIPGIHNVSFLEKGRPELYGPLMNGHNEVIEVTVGEERLKLLLRSTNFKLQEQEHKLILITNVKTEIDRAEMEAWRQLLQVLTHEIMNSVTPISSLSDTIKTEFDDMIKQRSFDDVELDELSEGLSVIKKRSAGLISFVHHYKSLISLPQPMLKTVVMADLFDHTQLLTTQYLQGQGIRLVLIRPLQTLRIQADEHMVEQIMLNLLHNAVDALQTTAAPCITIACEERADSIVLTVADNGSGIDKDIEDKIFVPFFTTRTNGTGIGLSLSKQIMHLHKGNISVHSSNTTGTVFSLRFPKLAN